MARVNGRATVAAFLLLLGTAVPALGVDEPMREFGLLLGAGALDSNWTGRSMSLDHAAPVFGLRYAYIFPDRLALFTDITYGSYTTSRPAVDTRVLTFRLGPELLLPWMSAHSRFFVAGSVGWLGAWQSHAENFNRPLAGLGFGQRYVTDSADVLRWELRAERTLGTSGLGGRGATNVQLLVGWSSGTPQIDSDLDGVPDSRDRCRATPRHWAVDAHGCPEDSDGDGVPDALDQCPDTPRGWPVDQRGCPLDSDGDGVPDGADRCPGTARGVKVDAAGCPLPAPTPTPVRAPAPQPVRPRPAVETTPPPAPRTEPIRGSLVLKGVTFASDSAELSPGSSVALEQVAASLREWPEVRVEVGGYTDATGTRAHNLDLSERRAKAVADFLTGHGAKPSQLAVKGYGDTKPVADNRTPPGRAANRRVVLTRLN